MRRLEHVDAEMAQPRHHDPALAQHRRGGHRARDVVDLVRLGRGDRLQLVVVEDHEQHQMAAPAGWRRLDHHLGAGLVGEFGEDDHQRAAVELAGQVASASVKLVSAVL